MPPDDFSAAIGSDGAAVAEFAIAVRALTPGRGRPIVNGRIDLAFTRLLPGQADLAIEVLTREPRLAALGRTHRLAARQTLRFADLRHGSFIVNPATPTEDAPSRWLEEQRRHGLPGRVAAPEREHPRDPHPGGGRPRRMPRAHQGHARLSAAHRRRRDRTAKPWAKITSRR